MINANISIVNSSILGDDLHLTCALALGIMIRVRFSNVVRGYGIIFHC